MYDLLLILNNLLVFLKLLHASTHLRHPNQKFQITITITSSMLAAEGNNRHLLSPLQETYKIWQSYIENDGLDKIDATIMRLAVDGLWLSEIFGLDALDESMREGHSL